MKQIAILFTLCLIIPSLIIVFFVNNNKKDEKIIIPSETGVTVRVKREASGEIQNVKLEDYVVGVVAGEMPVTFNIEALKAQAVAARSYVLKRIEYSKTNNFDVVDGTDNQVYLDSNNLKKAWGNNYFKNIIKIETAVLSTMGEYMSYNNSVADTLFFSTSNGYTENSEEIFSFKEPYLRSVKSSWDKEVSPVFNDEKTYSLEAFYSLTGLSYNNELNIEILKKSSTGRTLELSINGEKTTGSDIAKKLHLRSNDFVITKTGDQVEIKTTGYGHGVGMSQYGAEGMALAGYSYDKILCYYYEGAILKK